MELIKEFRRPKYYNTIISPGVKNNYQMDIIVYNRFKWKKYKYILCVIDVYSRYASCKALTNVREDTILNAMKEIFDEMGIPKNINMDNQFNTKKIKKYLADNGVNMFFSDPNEINKNAIVERFNRTLARKINEYRVIKGNYDWPSYLHGTVDLYNNTVHRTIKAKPIDVFEGREKNKQDIRYVKPELKVGDLVRIKRVKKVFQKADQQTLSRDVYEIVDKVKNRYKLKNVMKDEVNKKLYKEYELSKVTSNISKEIKEDMEHLENQRKERFIRRQKRTGLDVDEEGNIILPKFS